MKISDRDFNFDPLLTCGV